MQKPKTPNKRKLATVPFRTAPDSKTVQAAATHLGVEPGDLEKALNFSDTIREEAVRLQLKPAPVVLSCLNLVGDLTNEHFDCPGHKDHMVTTIFRYLWAYVGLPSDRTVGNEVRH